MQAMWNQTTYFEYLQSKAYSYIHAKTDSRTAYVPLSYVHCLNYLLVYLLIYGRLKSNATNAVHQNRQQESIQRSNLREENICLMIFKHKDISDREKSDNQQTMTERKPLLTMDQR